MLPVFRSNHHRSWKFHEFHRKAPVLEYHFFLKMMKLYEDTIDLLSFYKEHLYGPECPPSPLSTRGGGGLKKFKYWQKGGTCTFWIFRGYWVKIGKWSLYWGGGGRGRAEDFLKVIFNSWWNIAEDKKCKL